MRAIPFTSMLGTVQAAGEDFEWYPTTDRMIDVVAASLPVGTRSIMDIGAGDGRVLVKLAERRGTDVQLLAIEKSPILIQSHPENITPVGTDLFEQNLSCLPVDVIFCNPPYSQFALWASVIVETGHARKAFLIIPRRWADDESISAALARRKATARVIHSDHFHDAVRSARAVVDIVEISYPVKESYGYRSDELLDPFDEWFDQNISTFDQESGDDWRSGEDRKQQELARIRRLETIRDMVDAYNEEYARMEENYRAIFRLDYALLKELGVKKDAVRDGIKTKMAGLKSKYWHILFERLDTITKRLSAATKARFLEKLTGRAALAFTENNAYAIVLWAIKNANRYFNEQTVQLFRDLSTFDGVLNYKSNQRAWEKHGWRYRADEHSHYALDYRFVVERYRALYDGKEWSSPYDYPANLYKAAHETIGDVIAVLYNLGFQAAGESTHNRTWTSGSWQDWHLSGTTEVLFQVKAFKNGNIHFRFRPDAIKALNVEAGRLLGWLHNAADVQEELGYSAADALRFFHCTRSIEPSGIRLLAGEVAHGDDASAAVRASLAAASWHPALGADRDSSVVAAEISEVMNG